MTMYADTITPVTGEDRNLYHTPGNGYLGDFVETLHLPVPRRGRIYDAHYGCPESDGWLSVQSFLGPDPMIWKDCRWLSILVHGQGAIVVPEQLVKIIDPFPLDNNNSGLYFRLEERA